MARPSGGRPVASTHNRTLATQRNATVGRAAARWPPSRQGDYSRMIKVDSQLPITRIDSMTHYTCTSRSHVSYMYIADARRVLKA